MYKQIRLWVRFSPFVVAAFALWAYEYGPDPGYTGAPGDNATGCNATSCHTGTPNATSGGSVKIVASGGTTYVPGQTQQIQVTITDPNPPTRRYGFQLSARVDSNPKMMGAGTLASTDATTQLLDCKTIGIVPSPGSCPSGNTLQWIEHSLTGYQKSAAPATTYSFNWTPPATDVGTITLYAAGNAGSGALQVSLTHTYLTSLQLSPGSATPTINAGGIVPHAGSGSTIQAGEWVSIFGTNLASTPATWQGDFPTSLGGTSVMVNNKPAYLSFAGPGQIDMQAPDDTAMGSVNVTVTTASGSATSTVVLGQFAPAFSLLDGTHVAAIILRLDGSGTYGTGTNSYDIVGPTGTSLGYKTVAAKAGDILEIFGVGFGPTNPAVPAGKPFSGAAPTTNPVQIRINNTNLTPAFSGLTGAGLYQFNVTIPAGLGTGDQPLQGIVGGVQTQPNVVMSLQ
jgi:uncharacterized protein (TIGR03437 family)